MSDTTFSQVSSTPVHHGLGSTLTRLRAGVRRGHQSARERLDMADIYSAIETTCLLAGLVASSAIVMSVIAGARF